MAGTDVVGSGRRLVWGGRWSDLVPDSKDGWHYNDASLRLALDSAPEVVVLDALSFPWEVYASTAPDTPVVVVLPEQLGGQEIASALGTPLLRELTPHDRLLESRADVRELVERRFGFLPSVWLASTGPSLADALSTLAEYCNRRIQTVTADIGVFRAHQDDLVTRHLVEHGAHQRGTLDAVLSLLKAGDSVLDVGAHIGTFSVPLAQAVGDEGRVVAVEAMPENAALLVENAEANGLADRITVVPRPVGARAGQQYDVVQQPGNSGATRLVEAIDVLGDQRESETIDTVVAATGLEPTFIKLDVEGAEVAALRGAEATIARFRPTLVVEVSDAQLRAFGDSAVKLDRWFAEHDYEVLAVTGERNGRHPAWSLDPVTGPLGDVDMELFDVVARPRPTDARSEGTP